MNDPRPGTRADAPNSAGSTDDPSTSRSAGKSAAAAASSAAAAASSAADDARRRADDALSTGLDRGADNLKTVADAVEDASRRIRDESPDSMAAQLSDYCVDAARRISGFADGLRGRSIDDLASDVRAIARDNPAIFVAGSIAVGFAMSRFLRASAAHRPSAVSSRSPDRASGGYLAGQGDKT